jgi:nicotinamide-nucleotide amidase
MPGKVLFSMLMRKAHIISIGNELLIGDTVNTNASWLGSMLTEAGFGVEQVITIPDEYKLMTEKISQSLTQADLTITTGGLGPTHDDITKKVVSDIFGVECVKNEDVLNHIKEIFSKRDYTLSPSNAEQAMVPSNCDVLFNRQGTAPGMWFEKNGHYLAVLPGVPYEMKYLMEHRVKPKLAKVLHNTDVWVTEYFKTAGIPESTLAEQVGELDEYMKNGVGIAYLPSPGGVTIRVSASGRNPGQAEQKITKLRNLLNERAGDEIYGKGKELDLSRVVGDLLIEKNLTIATAESCTGGLLADKITNIPGCSTYMKGGIIAYSNDMKTALLGVDRKTIETCGAVSKEVALQMAIGAAKKCGADIGVSATGIAGPGGGTKEKPVGLVWMGFWIDGTHFALKSIFTNNRLTNKERTVMVVLDCLRRQLLGIDSYPYKLKPRFP